MKFESIKKPGDVGFPTHNLECIVLRCNPDSIDERLIPLTIGIESLDPFNWGACILDNPVGYLYVTCSYT